jgi:hypothetical protein
MTFTYAFVHRHRVVRSRVYARCAVCGQEVVRRLRFKDPVRDSRYDKRKLKEWEAYLRAQHEELQRYGAVCLRCCEQYPQPLTEGRAGSYAVSARTHAPCQVFRAYWADEDRSRVPFLVSQEASAALALKRFIASGGGPREVVVHSDWVDIDLF